MATYVPVHGGGHGGWCHQRVTRLVRSTTSWSPSPTRSGTSRPP